MGETFGNLCSFRGEGGTYLLRLLCYFVNLRVQFLNLLGTEV